MARLLQGTTTRVYGGYYNSFALLFDMTISSYRSVANAVARACGSRLAQASIGLSPPSPGARLESSRRASGVAGYRGRARWPPLCVVDTKRKRLSPVDSKLGIAQGDLYRRCRPMPEGYGCAVVLLIIRLSRWVVRTGACASGPVSEAENS